MQQPRGIAVILGVVISLGIIAVAVTGVMLIQRKPVVPAITNTNAALNLACTIDADCSSYCGADSCYQPICGTTTIGGTGSCTCRSLCGPIAPAANTNTSVNANTNANVNASTNANTNASVSTAGWKTYTNSSNKYSLKYPTDWKYSESADGNTVQFSPPDAAARTSIELGPTFWIKRVDTVTIEGKRTLTNGAILDDCVQNKKQATVNGIAVTQQDESCFATLHATYFPTASKFIQVTWAEVFDKNYSEYSKILSTFTFLDETAGWETYTSTKLGYTLKYPPTYTVVESSDGTVLVKDASGEKVIDTQYRVGSVGDSLALWYDFAPVGDVVLGGRQGKKFVFQYCDGPGCGKETVAIIAQHKGKLLALQFLGDKTLSQTEEAILSTFTFTK